MLGLIEGLLSNIVLRGVSPALAASLMSMAPRRSGRAELKKIYVLDEKGEMAGEYLLDPDCPIDYDDFLEVLPEQGIGHRESLFVGEYVFTAFQSGKFVFVLLSRGQLAPADFDWTTLLLSAADSHLGRAAGPTAPKAATESKEDVDKVVAEREARAESREKELTELELRLGADRASLDARFEELEREKQRIAALADGVSKAQQSLEVANQVASSEKAKAAKSDDKAALALREQLNRELEQLRTEKGDFEKKYREAVDRVSRLEQEAKDAIARAERERAEAASKIAEEEKTRREIESRVGELSQRFAAMAKEKLVSSNRTPVTSETTKRAADGEKAELLKERKFLQRRAIEMLDREERIRDREAKTEEREREFARREEELERQKAALAQAKPGAAPVRADSDEARKDIERRVKIIQQKALELLDREEKLRKRAAELQEMEARLAGKVSAR